MEAFDIVNAFKQFQKSDKLANVPGVASNQNHMKF